MAEPEIHLIDTSTAVALVVADHEAHDRTWSALADRRLGLAGHAWFETFSVLTRLPGSLRRDTATVTEILSTNFSESRFLDERSALELTAGLARRRISGGAVYDAVVGAAAVQHRLPLVSRDRRAMGTYRSLGVELEMLE